MALSKVEREMGYRTVPQPTPHEGVGDREKPKTIYCYEDGAPIRDIKGRALSDEAFRRFVKMRWILPIKGETLIEGGPAQRYRARGLADGLLPRFTKP